MTSPTSGPASTAGPRTPQFQLADDRWCIVCGERNPVGLHVEMQLDADRHMHAVWACRKQHQGFRGVGHGGIIALILDEMMLNLAWRVGVPAVTADLLVKLRRPVYVGDALRCEAWIEEHVGERLLRTRATAHTVGGELVAEAQARCVRARQATSGAPAGSVVT